MPQDVDDFLVHYGVKGMKWGVRKGQSSTDTTPSTQKVLTEKQTKRIGKLTERRVQAETTVKAIDDEIASMPPGIRKQYAAYSVSGMRSANVKEVKRLTKDIDAVERGKLTSTQKQLLVGAAVVGGFAAYTIYNANMESGNVNAMKLRGKAFLEGSDSVFAKNPKFASYTTGADVGQFVAKSVNPNYAKAGGQMNCRRCTMAYELRRRGFDVQATTSSSGWGQSESGLINAMKDSGRKRYSSTSLSDMVRGSNGNLNDVRGQLRRDKRTNKAENFRTDGKRESILEALGKQPVGARGEAVFNLQQFGHSLAWEKFSDGIYLFDTQKGSSYKVDDSKSFSDFTGKWGKSNDVAFTRLDNVKLDEKFVSRWATNSKK